MKNADMPAMAVKVVASVAAQRQAKGLGVDCEDVTFTGLTKREHFAAMALSGICIDKSLCLSADRQALAARSVQMADALLAALDD